MQWRRPRRDSCVSLLESGEEQRNSGMKIEQKEALDEYHQIITSCPELLAGRRRRHSWASHGGGGVAEKCKLETRKTYRQNTDRVNGQLVDFSISHDGGWG